MTKDRRRCKKLIELGAQLFEQLFLGLRDFFEGENEPQPLFVYVEKRRQFSCSFTKEKQLGRSSSHYRTWGTSSHLQH